MKSILLLQPKIGAWDELKSSYSVPLSLLQSVVLADKQGYPIKLIDQRLDRNWRHSIETAISEGIYWAGTTAMAGPQILHSLEMLSHVKLVDANIPIYNATHVILPVNITQSGETLSTLYYVPFNGSLSIPFFTVQKPYNNQYTLAFEPTYSTLTLPDSLSFYISSPYITFYGFTIYSSTTSPTGLGYLSSTGKLQLLASGNLTIVQPSGVQPPDRILINGVPYYSWSYSLDDNSISLTVPASQYTATVYYKSDITATISIIFAAITLMTTVLIVLSAFLILAFLRQSQNPAGTNISLSYETGAAITVIATILMVGVLIISAIWSAI
jgi:hypothetical protein